MNGERDSLSRLDGNAKSAAHAAGLKFITPGSEAMGDSTTKQTSLLYAPTVTGQFMPNFGS